MKLYNLMQSNSEDLSRILVSQIDMLDFRTLKIYLDSREWKDTYWSQGLFASLPPVCMLTAS